MSRWSLGVLLALSAYVGLCSSGCGGEEMAPAVITGMGGRGGRDAGPHAGSPDAGDEPIDPRAPVIEIIAPDPSSNPNDDEVITGDSLTVRCRVSKGEASDAREVDLASVAIEYEGLADNGDPTILPGSVRSTDEADELEATFDLDDIASGAALFSCTAADVGEVPLESRAELSVLVDHGPKITIVDPLDEAIVPLSTVVVKFRVEPSPLTSRDDEAEVSEVSLSVFGTTYDVVADPESAGVYTAKLEFDDPEVFPMPPSSASIVVNAKNSRTPSAAESSARVRIVIDSEPPVIAIQKPMNRQLVRGEVTLQLGITDTSGVDPKSIVATISPSNIKLTDWSAAGNVYTTTFDTRDATFTNFALLTINFEAADRAGNMGAASFTLRLDNRPPWVSLDPPLIREYQTIPIGTMETHICSAAFDPVGDAIGDLGLSAESGVFRAYVFDDTNSTPGAVVLYEAGVNENSVLLFVQPDEDVPILTDMDGDGVCDEINRDDASMPVSLPLTALPPKGDALYPPDVSFTTPEHIPPGNLDCQAGPGNIPQKVCSTTTMTRIAASPFILDAQKPAVFAYAPDMLACFGNAWTNVLSIAGEGWACLAARAEDKIGNFAVSPPIRVCFDDGVGTPLCDVTHPEAAPDCLGGCTAPRDVPNNITALVP